MSHSTTPCSSRTQFNHNNDPRSKSSLSSPSPVVSASSPNQEPSEKHAADTRAADIDNDEDMSKRNAQFKPYPMREASIRTPSPRALLPKREMDSSSYASTHDSYYNANYLTDNAHRSSTASLEALQTPRYYNGFASNRTSLANTEGTLTNNRSAWNDDRNRHVIPVKPEKPRSRCLPCFPCIRSTCGRCTLCICLLLLLIIIVLVIVVFTVFKLPTVDYMGLEGDPVFTLMQGNTTFGVDLVANIQVQNPNPIGFNFESIVATAYYPTYGPSIGGGNVSRVNFPSKSTRTIHFPLTVVYDRRQDPGFKVVQDLLTKCGITGGNAGQITIDYDLKVTIKIIGISFSPAIKNQKTNFDCPANIGDIAKGIPGAIGDLIGGIIGSELDGIASFLPPGFASLEDYLVCLQSFLDRCEPITSLMIVDYFTTNSWESRMPQEWREAFESKKGKLSSLDLMELVSLGRLREFNAPPAGSDGSSSNGSIHAADTTLGDQDDGPQDWPESLKDFVRMVKELSINRTLDPDYAKFKDTLDIHLIPGMSPKKLHEVEILSGLMASYAKEHSIRSVIDLGAGQGYLSRVLAFQHQLCVLGVDSNTIQTCGAQTTQKRTEKLFVNKTKLKRAGGGSKKASKQSRLAAAAASSASQSQSPSPAVSPPPAAAAMASIAEAATTAATTILSTVSTDSDSFLDTSSGPSSNPLTQQTAELSFGGPVDKVCKKLKTEESRSRSSSPATDSCGGDSSGSGTGGGVAKKASRSRRSKTRKTEDVSPIPSSELNLHSNSMASSSSSSSNAGPESKARAAKRGISNTQVSTSAATMASATGDARSATLTSQKTIDSSNDPSLAATPGSNFQLQHITHHITAATLPTLLKEHFPKKSKVVSNDHDNNGDTEGAERALLGEGESDMDDEEGRWTLCGLHACGDLTSNMIKLFLESSATCLFSVGCCYHWITERYDRDGNIVISDGTHGFPLSAAFNRYKAHLGEHAKMIACQSPERWLKYQKESEDAIHGHYFRALLHKLMVERGLYPGPPTTAPVLGRMGKHRLRGFPHYLATALNRLSLPADAIRPEEAQAAYEEFLEKDLYRIGILWALRTMLGPLFEGMILLDRATYLHENVVGNHLQSPHANKKKASVQLVAGFDVVESPRNMILIALKD
ncbi:hypothetical protein KVV02_004841 [Mortierella alpina]|uniref:Methyltransferase domain-containing protein n=1 Tax=Mortierella alpina TaxID=64518 RepID=A0A9P8A712_MORAP|nr:hypothetical protein KVV02_004841 [Mortierella alpina]